MRPRRDALRARWLDSSAKRCSIRRSRHCCRGRIVLLAGGKATGKNILGGQPCMALRAPGVHRLVPCEYRQQHAHRHRHLHRRRGAAAPRPHRACGAVRRVLRARMRSTWRKTTRSRCFIRCSTTAASSTCRAMSASRCTPATRFIATMNYGYAGTRELNEALVSRFTVIRMPTLDEAQLCELLRADVPAGGGGEHRALRGAVPRSERKGRERRDLDELCRSSRHDRGAAT